MNDASARALGTADIARLLNLLPHRYRYSWSTASSIWIVTPPSG